jgi:hypothetical protein
MRRGKLNKDFSYNKEKDLNIERAVVSWSLPSTPTLTSSPQIHKASIYTCMFERKIHHARIYRSFQV